MSKKVCAWMGFGRGEKKDYGYKVYGHPVSPNTRRVLAALHEKGLDFEAINVELKDGEHKSKSFLTLNPFGQVPVFKDEQVTLRESRAITQYIAYVHRSTGTQLLTLGSHESMGILTMWMEIEAQQFDPPASKLTWELIIKPVYGLQTNYEIVNENKEKLSSVLNVYEVQLKQSTYLAGDSFTLADLHHLPNLEFLVGNNSTKPLFSERPNVYRWVTTIMGRDAWKKACDAECWLKSIKRNK